MPLYEFGDDKMTPLRETTFAEANIKEREDLQRLLREQIEVIVPNGMVLAEEFSNWEDSNRRIDLLVLDEDANLVVVELKRTEDGGHMELQAIRYAAMVSEMTFDGAVEAHQKFLKELDSESKEDAKKSILTFLDWDEVKVEEFAQDVRIVLASADFSKELTTAVLWLIKRDIDIRCVRMVPYENGDQIILDVQQIIPLPEAVEYQVRVKEKASQERAARSDKIKGSEFSWRFWSTLVPLANERLDLHPKYKPSRHDSIMSTRNSIRYGFAKGNKHPRVEILIERTKEENKIIFDDLKNHQAEIEDAFGSDLGWERKDNRKRCRIYTEVKSGEFDDESTWEQLQDDMIETMRRFEAALHPFAEKYRNGDVSNGS